MDAKSNFFARMDAEHKKQMEGCDDPESIGMDFEVTSSGRTTIRDGVTESGMGDMDFSIATSGKSMMNTDRSALTLGTIDTNFTGESLTSVSPAILEAEIPDSSGLSKHEQGAVPASSTSNEPQEKLTFNQKLSTFQSHLPLPEHPSRHRSAPLAIPHSQVPAIHNPTVASQPSSAGSTASGFLNSLIDPAASTFNSTYISHTPPNHLVSSYEASHFGKRARSGSVSERLRVSTELELKGMIDREQKGILKDLIISGQDNELQHALDRYEQGDTALLESMVKDGSLSNRARDDIDLLGSLDLDFLNVNDAGMGDIPDGNIEYNVPESSGKTIHEHQMGQDARSEGPSDGIGELDFDGGMSDVDTLAPLNTVLRPHSPINNNGQRSRSNSTFSVDLDFRQRSNSLFSALIGNVAPQAGTPVEYGRWMEQMPAPQPTSQDNHFVRADKLLRRSSAPEILNPQILPSGARDKRMSATEKRQIRAEEKRRERLERKEQKEREKREKKEKREQAKLDKQKRLDSEEREEHEPGSGRPRSMSDPNIKTSIDSNGLLHVERPDGWIGAYSPESRKVRIARFLEKRNHRVWTKTVKYDVRKNFADSRLRVKGRFVKKEDELLMRELMSLT